MMLLANEIIFNQFSTPSKQIESKIKRDNDLFWNVYKNNPTEAIELLKDTDEQVVTSLTKVKKK